MLSCSSVPTIQISHLIHFFEMYPSFFFPYLFCSTDTTNHIPLASGGMTWQTTCSTSVTHVFMPDASFYLMCPSRPIGEKSAVTRMKNSLAASGKELQLLAGGWELLSRHHLCASWSHFWLSCLSLTCWTMQTVCRVTPICPCSLALKHLLLLL